MTSLTQPEQPDANGQDSQDDKSISWFKMPIKGGKVAVRITHGKEVKEEGEIVGGSPVVSSIQVGKVYEYKTHGSKNK